MVEADIPPSLPLIDLPRVYNRQEAACGIGFPEQTGKVNLKLSYQVSIRGFHFTKVRVFQLKYWHREPSRSGDGTSLLSVF